MWIFSLFNIPKTFFFSFFFYVLKLQHLLLPVGTVKEYRKTVPLFFNQYQRVVELISLKRENFMLTTKDGFYLSNYGQIAWAIIFLLKQNCLQQQKNHMWRGSNNMK